MALPDNTLFYAISDSDVTAFRASGQFDEQWYLNEYPDVAKSGIDAARHYLWIGRKLGRQPHSSGLYNGSTSLSASGQTQIAAERVSNADPGYIQKDKNVGLIEPALHTSSRRQEAKNSSVYEVVAKNFDRDYYLAKYADISASQIDPVWHYLDHGWRENRDPNPSFSTKFYIENNPDIVAAGLNPYFHYLSFGKREGRPGKGIEYAEWLAVHHHISPADIAAMKSAAAGWSHRPTFSVIMPVYNTPEQLLQEAVDSVIEQAYPHWELCIADDCSPSPHVRRVLDSYAARDQRIKIIYREENGHISEASNSALSIATGDWYALMDHDDLLAPHALYCMAHAIVHNPDAKLLYSDEDKINQAGQREGAYFKCDFNLELFRSHNLITHLGVYHRSLVEEIGGFRSKYNGAQDYDFALRCVEVLRPEQIIHVPRVLYHWRMIEGSTALSNDEKPYAMSAGERALNAHYERLEINAVAELIGFGYRTRYLLDSKPLVSIIIPTRNAIQLVKQCIDSILLKTTYRKYEILLVDNGSDDVEALAYFAELAKEPRIKVLRDDRPFNYSAINNNAAKQCKGEVLVLLNNDTEVISPDWLETMVGHAMQKGVGAVGAKLLYPDDRVQHAGVVMGLGGLAAHAHHAFRRHDAGFFGRLALANEFSAVTAACLVVKTEHFFAVGGLNETDLTVAYNDVDFCLKLQQLGLRNLYTPFAELYHYESATRGQEYETPEKQARFDREKLFMIQEWESIIQYDPAYNPNLTLDSANFGLAPQPRLAKIW